MKKYVCDDRDGGNVCVSGKITQKYYSIYLPRVIAMAERLVLKINFL